MFTPIHRALGVEPGPLTWELLQQAIAAGVPETADLDWKRKPHNTSEPSSREELAKDFAAMANSGGGWIVFGVKEDGESGAAEALEPCEWPASRTQQVRQCVYALVDPPVINVEFTPVPSPDGDGFVVAARIPDSADRPHFARKGGDALRAPYRNGPHTEFMTQRAIEQEFRNRFRARAEREDHLQSLFDEAGNQMNPREGVLLRAVAIPVEPLRGTSHMSHAIADKVLQAQPDGMFLKNPGAAPFMWIHAMTRRGLHRWTAHGTELPRVYAKSIHENGTVTAAYRLGALTDDPQASDTYPVGEPNHCLADHVEFAVDNVFYLIRHCAQTFNIAGDYQMRLGLQGNTEDSIYIRELAGLFSRHLLGIDYATPIRHFHPVDTQFDPLDSVEALLPVVRDAALDILNQGGVRYTSVLQETEPRSPN